MQVAHELHVDELEIEETWTMDRLSKWVGYLRLKGELEREAIERK